MQIFFPQRTTSLAVIIFKRPFRSNVPSSRAVPTYKMTNIRIGPFQVIFLLDQNLLYKASHPLLRKEWGTRHTSRASSSRPMSVPVISVVEAHCAQFV